MGNKRGEAQTLTTATEDASEEERLSADAELLNIPFKKHTLEDLIDVAMRPLYSAGQRHFGPGGSPYGVPIPREKIPILDKDEVGG